MDNPKSLSIVAIIVLSFFVLLLFFSEFNHGLSDKQEDWGAFGSYISGTIGVFAACLAVIWLIRSVSLQKEEFDKFKKEQERQTKISAISALLTSNHQAIADDRALLLNINSISRLSDEPITRELYKASIEGRISAYQKEIDKYEEQLKQIMGEPVLLKRDA